MRRTKTTALVAMALLADPTGKHWGYSLGKASGVRSGVLYPILSRMLDEGWLEDGWEGNDVAVTGGRPPRRYYTITKRGIVELGGMAAMAGGQTDTAPTHRFHGVST